MTKYCVKYSTFFYADLGIATDYISQFSLSAHTRFINVLFNYIEKLKSMPNMHAIYPFAPEYRHFVVDRFVVIYRFEEDTGEILIYRLLHGAQNISDYI